MPAAKPKPKRGKAPVKAQVKAQVVAKRKPDVKKPEPQQASPSHNGLPLKRKSVWAIDTDSPQFRAARKRDAQALRQSPDDRDSTQFLDAVLGDQDMQKWWN